MVMKQKRKLGNLGQHFLGGVATVIGLCALSTPAQAETVIFVLDQSGSMARAGLSGNIENGVRWDDATSAARVWAESYAQSAEQGHAVSVWGFKDGGAAQLWPSTDEDCTDLEGGEIENLYGEDSLDPIGTICLMPTDSPDFWQPFVNAFGPGEIDDPADNGVIYEGHPPIYGGPQTPLAEGLCTAITAVRNRSGIKSVILEADGNENNSDGLCFNAAENDTYSFPEETLPDWGYPLNGWEARTLRRVVRFPQTAQAAIVDSGALQVPSGTVDNSEWCRFFGPDDPGNICTAPVANPNAMHWKVDLHYSICNDTTASGVECADFVVPDHWAEESGLMARSFFLGTPEAPSNDSAGNGISLSRLSVAPAVASGSFTSIQERELALFETFANSTAKSSLRTFVRGDGTTYGVTHKLAGDVDDSGCTDQADLSIIKQKDVWLKQAVAPLQIAIKADLNRDGWVNEFDKAIVLSAAHWGEGCANPPAHPEAGPSCHNNVLDGNETDTDCGGEDCGNCAAHSVCETADDCVSGTCTGARCVAPVACTESKAIDLGTPGTTKTVANNACVKIKNVPSWWGTSRTVLLQTGSGGTYPVPYHWESSCKGTHGSGNLSGNWQSRTFGPTSKNCATLIQLNGTGGNVKLTYYGQ